MSCHLKQTSAIEDVISVRHYLFPIIEKDLPDTEPDKQDDEDWDRENWMDTWGDENPEEEDVKKKMENEEDTDWFQLCHISFSPMYDLMAISHQSKLVILTGFTSSKSDPATFSRPSRKYKISYKMEVADVQSEHVTSLLCVPLVSLKKTSHGRVDWSCIILGFNTGYVKIYTETGALLISQIFHESPVLELKCRTHCLGEHGRAADQSDEVTVLYGDALVVLDGFSLFQTLRACRSQVAIAAASGGMSIEPPPLSYKKWRVSSGQSSLSCHISPGVYTPDPFDHMRTASILGGYNAEIRGSAPAMSCYVATGAAPFTGYYYAIEGSSQAHLSHVALAVASKLKSALYNQASKWLSWGSGGQQEATASQKPKPKIELGVPLEIRCGLPDHLRHGQNIVLAPGASLSSIAIAVTTDSLGRVILMDVARAVALRMWKGYRDAQVGFVVVHDDAHRSNRQQNHHSNDPRSTTSPKHALFLLLYAPRRGLLEVWTCVNGPRVGAFNVAKNARLLYPGYGMMGVSSITMKSSSHMFQCCLLEANGQIREIKIPFHLALSDANSKKARDMHLLKKLSLLLHSRKRTGEEAVKVLLEIRISAMLKQALEKLLHTKKLGADTFRTCLSATQARLKEGGAILKKEDCNLLQYCDDQLGLIDLYSAIQKINQAGLSDDSENVSDIEDINNIEEMCKLLHMTRTEATEALHSMASFLHSKSTPKVRFDRKDVYDPSYDVAEFLDCFTHQENQNKNSSETVMSHMKLEVTESTRSAKLAQFLFHASLFGSSAPEDILFTLDKTLDLNPKSVLNLLFQHWLQQDSAITDNLTNSLGKLYIFVESVHRKMVNDSSATSEVPDSDVSLSLWCWIREDICATSHNCVASYFLAIVARAIAISVNAQEKEIKESQDTDDGWEKMQTDGDPPSYEDSCDMDKAKAKCKQIGEWETLWIDTEKWNLLVQQLEDCLLINTAINLGKTKSSTTGQKSVEEQQTTKSNVIDSSENEAKDRVSVKDLLSNGPGFIAELVAHGICQLELAPKTLKHHGITGYKKSLEGPKQKFLDFLHMVLYTRFPYSLSEDCLHAHCFWELMVYWNKEPFEISLLKTAVEHLQLVKNDPHARHGLSVMAWKTFITKRYIALTKLVDKVGKAPKERLCRKDVGISDSLMPAFCQACTDILQTIADADLDSVPAPDTNEMSNMPRNAEDAWQGVTGRRSIMDMGRAHSHAHYGLVQHNMHLSFILHATMHFSLRGVKPLSAMFDKRGQACFTMDLTLKDPVLPNPDSIDLSINKARQEFLTKVVTVAVHKLGSELENEEDSRNELEKWIETSVHMASEFQIDVEQVIMHHVNELFSNGLDELGHEVCSTVSDKEVLSSYLVLTVGQRLSYVLLHARSDDGVIMLSRMPPTLSTWIKSQDSSLLKKPEVPLSDTHKLAKTVVSMMSENDSQYTIALFLEEAASAISSS